MKKVIFLSGIVALTSLYAPKRHMAKSDFITQTKIAMENVARLDLLTKAQASTALTQANLVRFLYKLINGPGTSGYPSGYDGPTNGFLGLIRQLTGPTALGLGLSSNGINTCADIPSSGSATLTEASGTFTMTFGTPSKTIPTGYSQGGLSFDKKVSVNYNDGSSNVDFMIVEFSCGANVGYIRYHDNQDGSGNTQPSATARHIEVYYDTETSGKAKMELYMYYEPGSTSEYFAGKFYQESSSVFNIFVTRATASAASGARVAIRGNNETDTANVYMLITGNNTDTTTTQADSGDINSGGDLQCINFNDGGSASDATGSCGSLSLNTAGTPLLGITDFSISSVANMKANFTSL